MADEDGCSQLADHVDALVHGLSELLGKVREARGHRPMSSEGGGFWGSWVRVATDVVRSIAATPALALPTQEDAMSQLTVDRAILEALFEDAVRAAGVVDQTKDGTDSGLAHVEP